MQAIGRQPDPPIRAPDGAPSTASAADRSRPRCTAWCSNTPPPSSSRLHTAAGADLPQFVSDEFDAFLDCGILAHGLSNRRVWASLKDAMVAPDGTCADAKCGICVANALAPKAGTC